MSHEIKKMFLWVCCAIVILLATATGIATLTSYTPHGFNATWVQSFCDATVFFGSIGGIAVISILIIRLTIFLTERL